MIQEGRDGKADKVKKLREKESQDGWNEKRQRKQRWGGMRRQLNEIYMSAIRDNMWHRININFFTGQTENKRLFKNQKNRDSEDLICSVSHKTPTIINKLIWTKAIKQISAICSQLNPQVILHCQIVSFKLLQGESFQHFMKKKEYITERSEKSHDLWNLHMHWGSLNPLIQIRKNFLKKRKKPQTDRHGNKIWNIRITTDTTNHSKFPISHVLFYIRQCQYYKTN